MRVFCKNCKYYKLVRGMDLLGGCQIEGDKCVAPNNMKDSYQRSHANPIRKPADINRDNKCAWFEKTFLARLLNL